MTAVEWLEKKVWELDNEFFTVPNRLVEAISQAKELEKQQIIDTLNDGYETGFGCLSAKFDSAEQYYNETFNK